MRRESALIIICYAMVYVVWGTTYFFIKAAVETIPATLVVSLRFFAGAVIMFFIALRNGAFARLPSGREVMGSATLGILLLLLGNGLITVAEKNIPSYLASLIIACMPMYVALLNFLIYKSGIKAVKMAGVAMGVSGIAFLLYDGTSIFASLSPAVLIAIAGTFSWALGTTIAKGLPKAKDAFVSTMIQMLVAGAAGLILAIATDPGSIAALGNASAWSAFSVGYLAVLGSLTLVAYNHLLANEPSFRISSYSLVNPLIAVFLGLLSGEKPTPFLAAGVPLVLAGLTVMLYGDAFFGKRKRI